MTEPIAWGYRDRHGDVIDCISPKEHAKAEGDYKVPLYAGPPPDAETFATQVGFAMRLADAPLSEAQFVTLCSYLKARFDQ